MKAMDSPYLLNELRPPLKNSMSFSTTVETAARKERSKPEENLFPLPACKQNNSALSKINHAHIRLEGSIFYLGGDLGAGEGRLWQKIMFKYRAVSKKGTDNNEIQRKQQEKYHFVSGLLLETSQRQGKVRIGQTVQIANLQDSV